jgi:predicted alpha/beta-hydrolase family hydrolase
MARRDTLTLYSAASPAALFILAHGAGAGQHSSFVTSFARGMAERGVTTATFDFPYMAERRKVPDRAPVLEAAWRTAIDEARSGLPDLPLFIGGKSMGGRIASHVAAQHQPGVAGLVFLGYPLHPPGKPQQRRDTHLPEIREPMLFVQGTRDAFGTADEIRELVSRLGHAELHEVPGGDHSFKVSGGGKGHDVMVGIMNAVANWIKTGTCG